MAIFNFVNGNVVTQFLGMVVRLPSAGSALLADASAAANYAHIIGVRLADVAAAATGPVARLENGSVVRMAVEPAVGDEIYLSATVSAGLGVIVAPTNAISLGTCLAKTNIGGVWFATVTGSTPGLAASAPVTAGVVISTRMTQVTTSVSTSSTTWVDLLTSTFTTNAATTALIINAACNAAMSATGVVMFQIRVDGVAIRAGSVRASSSSVAAAGVTIETRVPVTPSASHTTVVRWRVGSALTGTIDPTLEQDVQTLLSYGILTIVEVSG